MIPTLLWTQVSDSLTTTSSQALDSSLIQATNESLVTTTGKSVAETVTMESGDGWWAWILELIDTLSIPLFSLSNAQVTLMSLTIFIV
ncbi:MAG: hypothetical protein ACO3MB_08595, partial [Saprospiraceae bacterium]